MSNNAFFMNVLSMAVCSGNLLDQIKKHIYYGKAYDHEAIIQEFQTVVGNLDEIKFALPSLDTETITPIDTRVLHAILGIATESSELIEALKFDGSEMDKVNVLEESFDVDWYQFILLDALNGDLETTWETGIAKLKARYPDKFSADMAINRDLDTERTILESGVQNDTPKEIIL